MGHDMKLAVLALSLLLSLSSCGREAPRTLIADTQLEVLERPSPVDYPTSNPLPNRVLRTVPKGTRVRVIGHGVEKDFMYYAIELEDGTRGYVINRVGAFHAG